MSIAPQGSIIRTCNGMYMSIPMNPIKNTIGSVNMVVKKEEKKEQPRTYEKINDMYVKNS